jgi:hypothetical protein
MFLAGLVLVEASFSWIKLALAEIAKNGPPPDRENTDVCGAP